MMFCKYAVVMDLSDNHINDLSEIGECRLLKELYLSHNQISIIDATINLADLTQLDLSFNEVDDLTPLFRLQKLEYVNLLGNPVPKEQIELLKKKGIIVVN
jgi:Leucine-rich repeat (LRR) protein